jgi:serine/threonine protein kinase
VAIKIYDKYNLKDSQKRKGVRREIKILERIRHENIVQLYEAFDYKKQVFLIMENVSGGSLHSLLTSKPNRQLKDSEAKHLFAQIAAAIKYCHSKNITHRDIKLENVLLDETKQNVKLIDFGFSTCIPNEKKIKIF